jgi:hypothetical protein
VAAASGTSEEGEGAAAWGTTVAAAAAAAAVVVVVVVEAEEAAAATSCCQSFWPLMCISPKLLFGRGRVIPHRRCAAVVGTLNEVAWSCERIGDAANGEQAEQEDARKLRHGWFSL